jgi:hypothetical protein
MVESYAECAFCLEKCVYRKDAANAFKKDPKFLSLLLNIIASGDQEELLDVTIKQVQKYLKNARPGEIIGLTYCMITKTLQELDLPKDLKQKMAQTMRLKLSREELRLSPITQVDYNARTANGMRVSRGE